MTDSPSTSPKPFCFVLMPFSSDFDDLYKLVIKEVCNAAGAYCERVDEQHYDGPIIDRILNQISKADLLICVMTGQNPNVFYEVGYAHGLGRKTILVTRDAKDIPFDMKHLPHIVYEESLSYLKAGLEEKVKWSLSQTTDRPNFFELELTCLGKRLSQGDVCWELVAQEYFPPVEIHNVSTRFFASGTYQVGVIVPAEVQLTDSADRNEPGFVTTKTLIGENMTMIPPQPALLPHLSLQLPTWKLFAFPVGQKKPFPESPQEVIFRVFTESRCSDFKVSVKWKNRTKSS